MSVSRRRFLSQGAAAAVGTALGVGLSVRRSANAQAIIFSTIEGGVDYQIERDWQNAINVVETSPTWPPVAPAEKETEYPSVVIKYDLTRVRSDIRVPNNLRLWLFRPKPTVTDPTTIYTPPSYQGHGPAGNYTLRFRDGTTVPAKENTPLWRDYLEPNWELFPGNRFTFADVVDSVERDNSVWPGPRQLAEFRWTGQVGLFPAMVPLRVALGPIDAPGQLLLTLLEIHHLGRLRLVARTLRVRPLISERLIDWCACARAGAGTMHSELDTLRAWRDQRLRQTHLGRTFVSAYYRLSPLLVRAMDRAPVLERPGRALIRVAARALRSRDVARVGV